MPLDDRQRAMLRAMGVPVWQPPTDSAADPPAIAAVAAPSTAAVSSAVPSRPVVAAPRPADPAPPSRPRAVPTPMASVQAPAATAPAAAAMTPPAHAEAVASMDWPALRAAVAACNACSLAEGRTQTVFGVGAEQAHWMIVGEAPGEQEDLSGEPFVGPAGRLLDQMLRAIGLTRAATAAEGQPPLDPSQQVFIANTLKCRPPRNRNPGPGEMAACDPFLRRQIELVQPKVILAMGRFAVSALLQTEEAIGRLRGRVHRHAGVPVIVTYHPAYLLRNLPDKARAWEDLCLAAQALDAHA